MVYIRTPKSIKSLKIPYDYLNPCYPLTPKYPSPAPYLNPTPIVFSQARHGPRVYVSRDVDRQNQHLLRILPILVFCRGFNSVYGPPGT